MDVLPQDLVKSRRREIGVQGFSNRSEIYTSEALLMTNMYPLYQYRQSTIYRRQ